MKQGKRSDSKPTRLRISIALFMLFSTCVNPLQAAELKPFTSDGCSAFPDGTPAQHTLWLSCCTTHDFAYWQGGTWQQRLDADEALEACVSAVGEPEIADVMLAAVRVGGSPYLPTRFRWGYGWPWPRFYSPLTSEELAQIADTLQERP